MSAYLDPFSPPPTPHPPFHLYKHAGDDLALCLRAVCWLAPRFPDPSLGRRAQEDGSSTGTQRCEDPFIEADEEQQKARSGAAAVEKIDAGTEGDDDEPLQLLLELAAGHLGAGVDGLHASLSLMGGTLGGLKSMRVRRAFAASLRAHLATVQVDSVFRFDTPKNYLTANGDEGVSSPGRLALPPMLNWASFRKYTVTMWVRPDPSNEGSAATLFRFRNGEGVGVEATLSAAGCGSVDGGGKSFGSGQGQGGREIVVTSFLKATSQKTFSAHCKFGSQPEAVHLGGGGVGEGVRQGGWRFVAVSHGQPYLKRSGRLRVSVDGGVVLETELQYPSGTGQASKDPISR